MQSQYGKDRVTRLLEKRHFFSRFEIRAFPFHGFESGAPRCPRAGWRAGAGWRAQYLGSACETKQQYGLARWHGRDAAWTRRGASCRSLPIAVRTSEREELAVMDGCAAGRGCGQEYAGHEATAALAEVPCYFPSSFRLPDPRVSSLRVDEPALPCTQS